MFSHLAFSYNNLDLFCNTDGQVDLRAWKDSGGSIMALDLQLQLYLWPTTNLTEDLFWTLFSFLLVLNLTMLTLDIYSVLSSNLLKDTFSQLQCLQNINFVGGCTSNLFKFWHQAQKLFWLLFHFILGYSSPSVFGTLCLEVGHGLLKICGSASWSEELHLQRDSHTQYMIF